MSCHARAHHFFNTSPLLDATHPCLQTLFFFLVQTSSRFNGLAQLEYEVANTAAHPEGHKSKNTQPLLRRTTRVCGSLAAPFGSASPAPAAHIHAG